VDKKLTIWKFDLNVGMNRLQVPVGSKVLSTHVQHDGIRMWALVDPTAVVEDVEFTVCGTGFPLPKNILMMKFIGTVLTEGGTFVWHVFHDDSTLALG